jgi:hypothetical protein
MEDPQIYATIERLVAEEHELWRREAAATAGEDDRRRLQQLRVSLDQCWDLLRQRRALRGRRAGSERGRGQKTRGRGAIPAMTGSNRERANH